MTLETLLAAANFVEANFASTDLTRGEVFQSPFAGANLSVCANFEKSEDASNNVGQNTDANSGGGGACVVSGNTRQLHNRLEKSRRAAMKEYFIGLRQQIPLADERRSSHLDVLRMAVKYVKALNEKAHQLEHNRLKLEEQKTGLEQRLFVAQLHASTSTADVGIRSPSTDTADDSQILSDGDETVSSSNSAVLSSNHLVIATVTTSSSNAANCTEHPGYTACPSSISSVSASQSPHMSTFTAEGSHVIEVTRQTDAVQVLAGLYTSLGGGDTTTMHAKVDPSTINVSTVTRALPSSNAISHAPVTVPVADCRSPACNILERHVQSGADAHCSPMTTNQVSRQPHCGSSTVQIVQQPLVQSVKSHVTSGASTSDGSFCVRVPHAVSVVPQQHAAQIPQQSLSYGTPVSRTLPAAHITNSNLSLEYRIVPFDQSQILAATSPGRLTSTPLLSPIITTLPRAVGHLVLYPTPGHPAAGFSISPFVQTLPFMGTSPLAIAAGTSTISLQCGGITAATVQQPVPMLQLPALLQSVPIMPSSSSVGLSMGSLVTATNDGATTVFVLQS
jgi:hypothetical protein